VAIQTIALGHLPIVSLGVALSFCAYAILRKQVKADAQTGLFIECAYLALPGLLYVLHLQATGVGHFGHGGGSPPCCPRRAGHGRARWPCSPGRPAACRSAPWASCSSSPRPSSSCSAWPWARPFTPLRALSFVFIWLGVAVFAYGAWKRTRVIWRRPSQGGAARGRVVASKLHDRTGHPPCDEGAMADDRDGSPKVRARRRKRLALAATVLGSSMAFIDGSVVNVALPAMRKALKADAAQVQWIVNAYLLLLGALVLIGGSAGDRYGRRKVFVIGVALFAAGLAGLRPGPGRRLADRRPRGAGDRRGHAGARQPGHPGLDLRRQGARRGDRGLGRVRGGDHGDRAGAGRLAGRPRLVAGHLPDQPAPGRRHRLAGPGGGARKPRPRGRAPGLARRGPGRRGPGRSDLGPDGGGPARLDQPAVWAALAPARPCWPASWSARRARSIR
jgi:hypothetical protein